MNYLDAAKKFIQQYFPNCIFALVAGSIVRGEATETSDLDIFIISPELDKAYRESFFEFGWPIEVFVHNLESYKDFFEKTYNEEDPLYP